MGVIKKTKTVEVVNLWNYMPEPYNCETCGKETEKHIMQEGARYHVLYGSSNGMECSEFGCKINHKCAEKFE